MSKPATAAPAVNRKLLVALGALVVGTLLVMFVVLPLFSDDAALVEVPNAAGVPAPPAPDGGDEEAEDGEPVPETFEVFSARDPFQQLVTEEGQRPPQETPVDPGTAGSQPAGSQAATATPTVAGDAQVGATTVHLAEVIDGKRVRVLVNDASYEVAQGDAFAEHFRLLEITDGCATLLFGDNRFALCQGEQIRK